MMVTEPPDGPNDDPDTVIRRPPFVKPVVGYTEDTEGALYEKVWAALVFWLPTVRATRRPAPTPDGILHTICVEVTEVVVQVALPINTDGVKPKLDPAMVREVVTPPVGALVGEMLLTTGAV